MENILSLIYTLFAFCYCREEHNITFHESKTTWDEAVRYCSDSGGVLYSDEADIRNKTEYGDDEVWTGKYKAFTPWAITLGCYRINFDDNSRNIFSVQHSEQPECQKICTWTDFFAIKGRKCKCVQRDELQIKDRIRPCNCTTCVTVLRHGIANIREESETGCSAKNTNCLCVAATCEFKKLTLTPEICSNDYKSICDNNITLHPAKQIEAKTFCYNQNSILRWYTTDKDICDHGVAQHWTSGRRSVHEYIVQHNGDGSDLNPLQCFRVKKDNNDESYYADCDKFFPFFCKIVILDWLISVCSPYNQFGYTNLDIRGLKLQTLL
ncbi:unnamed protein product [Mytilus coruscus]|uniref:C-type lectin domain-containing protein n=1 Tax=Mytilus coruscus TaxID=42192 RepID=A0A6J8AQK1_MYTCO|nr:unnamed protein product [Mytilus coruscus]